MPSDYSSGNNGYFNWAGFNQGNQDFTGLGAMQEFSSNPAWRSGQLSDGNVQQVGTAMNLFQTQFKNLVGRDPTPQEVNGFAQNALYGAWNQPGDLTYGDSSGLANSYISNNFGPQEAQYQQQQQTDQLGKSQTQVQDLINKTMGNTASQLTDPTSQLYQQLSGSMNNLGITPSSGAFQSGVGSTIANSGMNAQNAALQAIGIPGIQNIANTGQAPYNQSFGSGQTALGNLEGINNFSMQAELAKLLASQGQPSGAQNILGMAGGAAGGAGSLLSGGAQAYQATWICTQLKQEGLLSDDEIKVLHDHLYKAFWSRPFKFVGYLLFGKLLVYLANKYNTNWRLWKQEFYDEVMEEADPVRAVDVYARKFWKLYLNVSLRKHSLEMVR